MLRDKAKECIESELKYGDPYNEYHYNCAETMLNAANDYYELNLSNKTLNMILPFGSGRVQGVCGMLTGGASVLGVIFTEDKPSYNDKVKEITDAWVNEFMEEFKYIDCKVIKSTNGLTEDEPCTYLIFRACDMLEGIIDKYRD